jgi:hypothetical protein
LRKTRHGVKKKAKSALLDLIYLAEILEEKDQSEIFNLDLMEKFFKAFLTSQIPPPQTNDIEGFNKIEEIKNLAKDPIVFRLPKDLGRKRAKKGWIYSGSRMIHPSFFRQLKLSYIALEVIYDQLLLKCDESKVRRFLLRSKYLYLELIKTDTVDINFYNLNSFREELQKEKYENAKVIALIN